MIEALPQSRGAHAPFRQATAGPPAFTFGTWFTWTAVGVAFPAFSSALLAASRSLAESAYETPSALAAAHLATLGWGTMTTIGAFFGSFEAPDP